VAEYLISHPEKVDQSYSMLRRQWNFIQLNNKVKTQPERQIKGWSRAKKEALIRRDFDLLQVLAECGNESHYKNKL